MPNHTVRTFNQLEASDLDIYVFLPPNLGAILNNEIWISSLLIVECNFHNSLSFT